MQREPHLPPLPVRLLQESSPQCLRIQEQEDQVSAGSFPKWLQQPGQGQAEVRSPDVGSRVPRTWAITSCLPRHKSRKLDWKRSIWNTSQHSNVMPTPQAASLTSSTTVPAGTLFFIFAVSFNFKLLKFQDSRKLPEAHWPSARFPICCVHMLSLDFEKRPTSGNH